MDWAAQLTLCYTFLHLGVIKSVQWGMFIKSSELSSSVSNLLSLCHQPAAMKEQNHTERIWESPSRNDTASFFHKNHPLKTARKLLHKRLPVLTAGPKRPVSCYAVESKAHTGGPMPPKRPERIHPSQSSSELTLGIRDLVSGWRGLEPFWPPCSHGRKETVG